MKNMFLFVIKMKIQINTHIPVINVGIAIVFIMSAQLMMNIDTK